MFGPALIALLAVLFSSLSGAEAQAPAAPARSEAPTAIPPTKGEWHFQSLGEKGSRFSRTHNLYYQAPVFPNLSLNLVHVECGFGGLQRFKVTGMVPAQRFPQPEVTVAIGSRAWSAIPNARYMPRSQPHGLPPGAPPLKLGGKTIKKTIKTLWPGHPPYAELEFVPPGGPPLLDALASGQSLWVEFEAHRNEYPAPPADISARYRKACAALYPPGYPGIG